VSDNSFATQQSLLDRLIDYEPEVSREPVRRRVGDYRQLLASVRRDIENLLNTKSFAPSQTGEYRELQDSLFVYGLPDFTAESPRSDSVRDRIREEVEKAVRTFEPRIANVSVTYQKEDQSFRTLGFRIAGLLMVDPAPEPITFDTMCDINRGEFRVT